MIALIICGILIVIGLVIAMAFAFRNMRRVGIDSDRAVDAVIGGILGVGVGENYFASDVTALVGHTRNVIYLEDGEFASLTPDGITVYDCTGKPVEKQDSEEAGAAFDGLSGIY